MAQPKKYLKLGRDTPSAYRKKHRDAVCIDLSLYKYLIGKSSFPSDKYPKTSKVADDYIKLINAIDYRKTLLVKAKKRGLPINTEKSKASYCLTVLSNRSASAKELIKELFKDELSDLVDAKKIKEKTKKYITAVNNYRHNLKKYIGEYIFDTTASDDDAILAFINSYSNNGKWISLKDEVIDFYKSIIHYWRTNIIYGYSWEQVYLGVKANKTKPNETRFIHLYCEDNKYPRGTAQIYLTIYNKSKCFTNDDIAAISKLSRKDFLSILKRINHLSKK